MCIRTNCKFEIKKKMQLKGHIKQQGGMREYMHIILLKKALEN